MYLAQLDKPTNGDFVNPVKKDLMMLGISYDEATSTNMSKKMLKEHATSVAFEKLLSIQKTHSKIKDIKYEVLETQTYLKSQLFSTRQANMLTALRSHCVRGIKSNFNKFYKNQLNCPLQCNTETPYIDTQEHTLNCSSLKKSPEATSISFMYGNVDKQYELAKKFSSLMRSREKILEAQVPSLPGASIPDQSPRQQQQQGAAAGQSLIVMQLG